MPTTRSASKKQANLEYSTEKGQPDSSKRSLKRPGRNPQNPDKSTTSANISTGKRGSREPDLKLGPASKKRKQQQLSSNDITALDHPIVINRAPVLQLWGAVVAEFLYPELSWPACLSIGSAISALCAISKGRAIGTIEPKDQTKSDERKDEKDEAGHDTNEYPVMGFPLHLDGDAVLVSGRPKHLSEGTLANKFGEGRYDAARKAMSEALESWSDEKDELNKEAFRMYENFRPNVAAGQKGWGRKGELNLHQVISIVKKV